MNNISVSVRSEGPHDPGVTAILAQMRQLNEELGRSRQELCREYPAALFQDALMFASQLPSEHRSTLLLVQRLGARAAGLLAFAELSGDDLVQRSPAFQRALQLLRLSATPMEECFAEEPTRF